MKRLQLPTAAIPTGLSLHLGCGLHHMQGWLNCDREAHSPNVDCAFDLMEKWPFTDNSVARIYASHVLEHLPDPFFFFREAWRVCKPYAEMTLRTPYGGSVEAWHDLTHLRPWYPACYAFLQPGYAEAIGNPQGNDWEAYFGIDVIQVRLVRALVPWVKWRSIRKRLHRWFPFVQGAGIEMHATFVALKHAGMQREYQRQNLPNSVPLEFVVYQHDWERRELQPGEAIGLKVLE